MVSFYAHTRKKTLVALCAAMFMLWMSFAYIDHQYDLSPQHHEHHQCQLFANALHGTLTAPIILASPQLQEPPYFFSEYPYIAAHVIVPLARAPPESIYT
ncbi:DUF2607 family protein [Vibrio sp. LaRot3]|uniref:DUF2607 family protein n=1 Tax=Vibrio sp. LaRot3 TaxID=2998829 RepID=UPI0022CE04FA|nr:DUF2607 family protein [Vibrio sp. LaRot3]MDA0149912.1 DUF2607 family protein [Vibrio sp. LaRot3]